jgi:Arc/MetJ family transcription regulator
LSLRLDVYIVESQCIADAVESKMVRINDIDLDEGILSEAMRLAGITEPREAVLEAIKEYTRPKCQ